MHRLRTIGTATLAAGTLLLVLGADTTRADDLADTRDGSWEHVDELAQDLEGLAEKLHDRIHRHLEGHEYFREIDGYTTDIEELAVHIHEIAHEGGNIAHLREDVDKLDRLTHNANEVITKIARRGVISIHFDGGVRQTRALVRDMLDILHHLQDDLAQLDPPARGRHHETRRPVVRTGELADTRPGTWEHVDELAQDLQKLAEDLHDEIHHSLEADFHFKDLDAEVAGVEKLAVHIHEVAHKGGNVRHLREDVTALDRRVHSADRLIARMGRRSRTREFDEGIRAGRRIMESMTALLHHLEDDLAKLDPHGHRHEPLRPRLDDRHSHDLHDHDRGHDFERHRFEDPDQSGQPRLIRSLR